jgi:hypothetical protein
MNPSGVAGLPGSRRFPVKKLIALLAVAGLSGCVGYYGAPYGSADGYYGSPYYGAPYYGPSGSIYGSGGWSHPNRFGRDRDRDGIPDRRDRDRDGDGVSNRRDAFPNDPRRQ